jgi:dynein heavy chain
LLKDQWELELKARKIPFTENLNLIAMLVDPPTVSLTLASRIRISALV